MWSNKNISAYKKSLGQGEEFESQWVVRQQWIQGTIPARYDQMEWWDESSRLWIFL